MTLLQPVIDEIYKVFASTPDIDSGTLALSLKLLTASFKGIQAQSFPNAKNFVELAKKLAEEVLRKHFDL